MPLLLSLVTAVVAQDPAPGIARELARERAALVRDVQYDLHFRVEAGAPAVDGTVTLRFRLPEDAPPAAPLVLDWGGEPLADVLVNTRPAAVRAVHDHVLLPPDALVAGWNVFQASFRSKVAATGTPLTVYRDPTDGREYWYTLVVPADAHRLYPCFDQPDLRAVFRLELDLPREWTAVANTARVAVDERDRARDPAARPPVGALWSFAPTRPLPTYLAAFAAGPFRELEAPQPDAPGVTSTAPMRLLLRESQLAHAERDVLVRLHRDGLAWLAHQFGVPYPFDKLDVVLLPGFPYGGMEHAGAIFYREQALVFDHVPTAAERVRRSTLVYHELAHQWFGNLVTMRWFDDLWLKEGFATFVGYQAMAALEPAAMPWLRFGQRVKPRAYEIDATPGTTPVFQELQNLADAKSAYGAIVYNKAPAVLRALHERLGADTFRAGLRRYLERHAFGSAEWQDLAAALEDASRSNLERWSERWLLAPSMPQVRVAWTTDGNGLVRSAQVTQRALGGGPGTWPLDLELLAVDLAGGVRTVRVRSDAPAAEVPELVGRAAPAAVLANPHDVAYGQFVPDEVTRAWLLEHVATLDDPQVRASAVAALHEAVREAELDPAAFAGALLALLAQERDADTHGWLLDQLAPSLHRWLDDARGGELRARAADLLLAQLRDEAGSGRELGAFRFLARYATDPRVLELCRAVVHERELPVGLTIGKQDAYLAAAALLAAGAAAGELEQLEQRFRGEDAAKERFLAGAAAPDAAAKARYWALYLEPSAVPEQWIQDSLSWFHWPRQAELTLPWLGPALERVDWVKANRRIFFMPAWLDAFVNAHASAEALAIVDEFVRTRELSTDIRQKLLQARDGLARAVRIRARFGSGR